MILKGELAQPASHTGYQYCRKWLHTKVFQVKHITKGIYVDGHKRAGVLEACNEILKTMTSLGFLKPSNAPNEEMVRLLLESWFLLIINILASWQDTLWTHAALRQSVQCWQSWWIRMAPKWSPTMLDFLLPAKRQRLPPHAPWSLELQTHPMAEVRPFTIVITSLVVWNTVFHNARDTSVLWCNQCFWWCNIWENGCLSEREFLSNVWLYGEMSALLTQLNLYRGRGLSDSHKLSLFLQLYNGHPWKETQASHLIGTAETPNMVDIGCACTRCIALK